MRRRGVYPGSFNPPTTAHLAIAEAAQQAHDLDTVQLSVSVAALAKEDVEHPRFEDRIEVLNEVVADLSWLEVHVTNHQLLAEIARGFDVVIVGADKWWQIQDPRWYGDDPEARDAAIQSLPTVAIAGRDALDVPATLRLDVGEPTEGISSTRARDGALDLMAPAARAFAQRTGAWIDRDRYDRWVAAGPRR